MLMRPVLARKNVEVGEDVVEGGASRDQWGLKLMRVFNARCEWHLRQLNADFSNANLKFADLTGAKTEGANFEGCVKK